MANERSVGKLEWTILSLVIIGIVSIAGVYMSYGSPKNQKSTVKSITQAVSEKNNLTADGPVEVKFRLNKVAIKK